MTEPPTSELIAAANKAVAHAQSVRAHHARRTHPGSRQRQIDIDQALKGMAEAMKPIRRRIGKLPYINETGDSLRDASHAIQRERRKLWKMTQSKRRKKS